MPVLTRTQYKSKIEKTVSDSTEQVEAWRINCLEHSGEYVCDDCQHEIDFYFKNALNKLETIYKFQGYNEAIYERLENLYEKYLGTWYDGLEYSNEEWVREVNKHRWGYDEE